MLPAEEANPDNELVGKVIASKYRIVKLLGEGGMGCVYVGEQQMGTTVRKVAVKTLHKHLSTDPAIKARFTREVGTIAQLEHPNTIQVFDFGSTDDGLLYIVMELVQGKSVEEILGKEGRLDPARVENIMRQIAGSLAEAHGHGIVHRDLKPDNVVLCERAGQKDWVEVLDFGIAKRSSETDEKEQKLTQQGMVVGTPPYMSPEQFTGQPVDARSDIYSLGVMAYEMLTGELPFAAGTAWEWATQHMTVQPKPFEATPNGALLPPKMRVAVMKALAKKQDERWSSVKEFYEAFSTGSGSAAQIAPVDGPVPASLPHGAAPAGMTGPMQGMPPGSGDMGAAAQAAAPYSGGAGAPKGKTEVGTPVFAGGPPDAGMGGGASPYAAPPTPMGGPAMSGPGAGMAPGSFGAPIPAPPPRDAGGGGGGGNRGLLIGIAAAVAVLTIAGIGISMAMGGRKPVPVVTTADTTTATPTDTTAPTGSSSAAPDNSSTTATDDNTKPLGPSHPTYTGPTGPAHPAAHDAGHPSTPGTPTGPATTPTTPQTAAPAIPTPTPKPALPPAVQQQCNIAAMARMRNIPNPSAEKACKAGGGTF
jgi:serine/threonine-protein kinase